MYSQVSLRASASRPTVEFAATAVAAFVDAKHWQINLRNNFLHSIQFPLINFEYLFGLHRVHWRRVTSPATWRLLNIILYFMYARKSRTCHTLEFTLNFRLFMRRSLCQAPCAREPNIPRRCAYFRYFPLEFKRTYGSERATNRRLLTANHVENK